MFKRGQVVWGKLKSYPWWPAVVLNPEDCGRDPIGRNEHWIFWLGEEKISLVDYRSILDFESNYDRKYIKKNGKKFKIAVETALIILANRYGIQYTDVSSLSEWAKNHFSKIPSSDNPIPNELPDIVKNALRKNKFKRRNANSSDEEDMVEIDEVLDHDTKGHRSLKDVCVRCLKTHDIGGVCRDCKSVNKVVKCRKRKMNRSPTFQRIQLDEEGEETMDTSSEIESDYEGAVRYPRPQLANLGRQEKIQHLLKVRPFGQKRPRKNIQQTKANKRVKNASPNRSSSSSCILTVKVHDYKKVVPKQVFVLLQRSYTGFSTLKSKEMKDKACQFPTEESSESDGVSEESKSMSLTDKAAELQHPAGKAIKAHCPANIASEPQHSTDKSSDSEWQPDKLSDSDGESGETSDSEEEKAVKPHCPADKFPESQCVADDSSESKAKVEAQFESKASEPQHSTEESSDSDWHPDKLSDSDGESGETSDSEEEKAVKPHYPADKSPESQCVADDSSESKAQIEAPFESKAQADASPVSEADRASESFCEVDRASESYYEVDKASESEADEL